MVLVLRIQYYQEYCYIILFKPNKFIVHNQEEFGSHVGTKIGMQLPRLIKVMLEVLLSLKVEALNIRSCIHIYL